MALIETPEARQVIGCAIRVHSQLGPGMFESVYGTCLAYEMRRSGLRFRQQAVLPVRYDNIELPRALVADFIVEDALLLEIKCVDIFLPVHDAQVITYLRLSDLPHGLLINFKVDLLKHGLKSFLAPKRRAVAATSHEEMKNSEEVKERQ